MKNTTTTEINFSNSFFDAIICLDANLPDKNFFDKFLNQRETSDKSSNTERLTTDNKQLTTNNQQPTTDNKQLTTNNQQLTTLIAADGAGIRLYEMGVAADYIIGDLDTFYKNPVSSKIVNSEIICLPDQDTNDFEKALNFAMQKGFNNLLITGFHGGELEHTLNNWSVFIKFSKRLNLCIYDSGRYGIPVYKSISLKTKPGELISIIPQPQALLTTRYLKWELINELLELGVREGARNISVGDKIEINVHEGETLVFFDERLPFAPDFVKVVD